MRIRLKKGHDKGILRVESIGEIKEVFADEDILNPGKEVISVCFKGQRSSGIIDFKHDEIEKLYNSIKKKDDLMKSVKAMVDVSEQLNKISNIKAVNKNVKKRR